MIENNELNHSNEIIKENVDSTMNETTPLIECSNCKNNTNANDKFCNNCGYPINGTAEEINAFIANVNVQKIDLEVAEKKINQARNYVFVIAAFTFLSSAVSYFISNDTITALINLVLTGIYVGLAFWTKKKAFAAILVALILYLTIHTVNAFIDPLTIVKGIFIKIIIIGLLIKGIRGSLEAEKINQRIY